MPTTRPSRVASETKSATDEHVERFGGCLHCGHDVVEDLIVQSIGTYLEIACRSPFACFERVVLRTTP